jgi:hypothetical protein
LFLLVYVPASEARSARIEEANFVPIGGIEQWITIKGGIAASLSYCSPSTS